MNHVKTPSLAPHSHLEPDAAWRQARALQQPSWSAPEVAQVKRALSDAPPLIFPREADQLRDALARAGAGKAFVLTGGDCAETFAQATADRIQARVKTILQMAMVLTYGAQLPVVKIGRMAGQYAKPRSSDTETREGQTLPAYRGDAVNGFEFTPESRRHDPSRLMRAYHTSASVLNLTRAFTQGGFADVARVHEWNRGFVQNPANAKYESIAADIDRAMKFMRACGAGFEAMRSVDLYSSHEGLVLDYEEPLTRIDPDTGDAYATSAHFLWIGERTRGVHDAHVKFCAGIANPLGVKLGPSATPDDALRLCDALNPKNVPGRLSFIARMGSGRVQEKLPDLLRAVSRDGREVTWMSDPMHGNTITSDSGFKTRRFDDVVAEVQGFFEAHREAGTWPGGLHVELTGDDVTECLGGTGNIADDELSQRYETLCDPRLNHQQSLELAFLTANMLQR